MANNSILVFAEQRDGSLKKAAFEAVSEGRRLADQLGAELHVALLGSGLEEPAGSLEGWGADQLHTADHPELRYYSAEGYSHVLSAMIGQLAPAVFLLAATAMGKDVAPRVAAICGAGLATDCTALTVEDGQLTAQRPVYAGKAIATVRWADQTLQMATLRPNVFPAEPREGSGAPAAATFTVDGLEGKIRARVQEVVGGGGETKDVTEADVIVAGGRGMKGAEHFSLLEDLAATLDGAVGASRAVVDSGWVDHQKQVGQTGKTVSPQLYIACGISGAIQHLAGMSSSKCIAAVNKDPEAPIFKVADYGIVGDLFEVLPVLTEEIARLKE
jgi:electron transfer flavoprotein alpha subunit